MNIFVIGGNGFLGTRLVSRLEQSGSNYKVGDINKIADNNQHVYLNVEDIESLNQLKGSDILINLAAVHRDDVRPISRYDDVNVKGAENICNAARNYGIKKIIFTSSVAVYGFAPANTDESGNPNYFNDYGRTKYLAEQVYKTWQSEDPNNRTLIIVRPTVIFGEGNRGNVYNLLKQIASRRFIMLGNGMNKKSMAYVENVAAFLEWCLTLQSGLHIYNYIDKPDFDMNTLISKIRKILFNKDNVGLRLPASLGLLIGCMADLVNMITRRNLPVSSIRIKKFMATTQFSSSYMQNDFLPPVSLEDGLSLTLNYEFVQDNSNKRTFETE